MKLTKSKLKQIIREELNKALRDASMYTHTGKEAPLTGVWEPVNVNGITIGPITNAGQTPHTNKTWMADFGALKSELKDKIENGEYSEYETILIEPMWGRSNYGQLMATTEDGNTKYIPLSDWKDQRGVQHETYKNKT